MTLNGPKASRGEMRYTHVRSNEWLFAHAFDSHNMNSPSRNVSHAIRTLSQQFHPRSDLWVILVVKVVAYPSNDSYRKQ